MKQILMFLIVLLVATGANARDAAKNVADIQATTHSDGILFEVNVNDSDLEISVSGPDNLAHSINYAYAESVFFDASSADGNPMPDGLYKYEAKAVPTFKISREESSKMPDRNVLYGKTDAKVSAVSGTFRILNGSLVDSDYEEYSNPDLASAENAQ